MQPRMAKSVVQFQACGTTISHLAPPACLQGDVNDESGFSPFPGNINQLVIKVDSYARELERSGGIISEFVNPKYKDASKTTFKSSTRLECMMQVRLGFRVSV